MRRLLTPGWLVAHTLVVVLVVGMLWLGAWQYDRATAGNALSWGYTLQWPLFAAFTAYLWLREMGRRRRAGDPSSASQQPTPTAGGSAPATRPPVVTRRAATVVEDDDPDLAAYNHYLDWLNAHPGARSADYPGRV